MLPLKHIKPAIACFQAAAYATSESSWTHFEESANCPLLCTWAHTCSPLVRDILIVCGESTSILPTQKAGPDLLSWTQGRLWESPNNSFPLHLLERIKKRLYHAQHCFSICSLQTKPLAICLASQKAAVPPMFVPRVCEKPRTASTASDKVQVTMAF